MTINKTLHNSKLHRVGFDANCPQCRKERAPYNNTGMTLDAIRALPFLGRYRNEWRQIDIDLYELDTFTVISIGTEYDGTVRNAVAETRDDHWRALDAFKHGRKYVAR
jgi:hypothetical protein